MVDVCVYDRGDGKARVMQKGPGITSTWGELVPDGVTDFKAVDSALLPSKDSYEHWMYDGGQTNGITVDDAAYTAALQPEKISEIDAQSELKRQNYLTGGETQQLVYDYKVQQAQVIVDGGVEPPDPTVYPLIKAEVDARTAAGEAGVTLLVCAQATVSEYNGMLTKGGEIEKVRREYKIKVGNATTSSEIDTLMTSFYNDLNAIL